jgi:HK97 gp10 family phage protein
MSTVSGVDSLKAALKKLPPNIAEKLIKQTLRKAANDMARQARANAPVKTGRLRKSIRVANSRINRLNKNGKIGLYLRVNPGRSRKDPKGAWYGQFVESGYNKNSQLIGGREAMARGIITRDQLQAKRAKVAARRRFGQVKQGIRYRTGGNKVEGQYFLRRAFDAKKDSAAQLILVDGQKGVEKAAKELGF